MRFKEILNTIFLTLEKWCFFAFYEMGVQIDEKKQH